MQWPAGASPFTKTLHQVWPLASRRHRIDNMGGFGQERTIVSYERYSRGAQLVQKHSEFRVNAWWQFSTCLYSSRSFSSCYFCHKWAAEETFCCLIELYAVTHQHYSHHFMKVDVEHSSFTLASSCEHTARLKNCPFGSFVIYVLCIRPVTNERTLEHQLCFYHLH